MFNLSLDLIREMTPQEREEYYELISSQSLNLSIAHRELEKELLDIEKVMLAKGELD